METASNVASVALDMAFENGLSFWEVLVEMAEQASRRDGLWVYELDARQREPAMGDVLISLLTQRPAIIVRIGLRHEEYFEIGGFGDFVQLYHPLTDRLSQCSIWSLPGYKGFRYRWPDSGELDERWPGREWVKAMTDRIAMEAR